MLNKGFEKAIVDGVEKNLRERIELKKNFKHDIDIVVDEIFVSEFRDDTKAARERASEAIERALQESEGLIKITEPHGETHIISAKFMCANCGFSFPEVVDALRDDPQTPATRRKKGTTFFFTGLSGSGKSFGTFSVGSHPWLFTLNPFGILNLAREGEPRIFQP